MFVHSILAAEDTQVKDLLNWIKALHKSCSRGRNKHIEMPVTSAEEKGLSLLLSIILLNAVFCNVSYRHVVMHEFMSKELMGCLYK